MQNPKFWQTKNIISVCLLPLSAVYYCLMQVDKFIKKQNCYISKLPVISVGNITVGGSGKSPVVSFIAEELIKNGETVAILSRGYGVNIKTSKQVDINDSATEVGDEPLMLKRQNPKAQIWVGSKRKQSAKLAEKAGASCILLDDGFQHWAINKDIDIVLIDKIQVFGNGFMLPAGCLREPKSALKRADFVISMNGKSKYSQISLNLSVNKGDIAKLKGKKLLAFTAIAQPNKFFNSLSDCGLEIVETMEFSDHHFFTTKELEEIKNIAKNKGLTIVTTAKDAVKLNKYFCDVVKVNITGDKEILMAQIEKVINEKN